MDMDARVDVLTRCALFKNGGDKAIRAAAASATELSLEVGEHLFHQGDESSHGYLLAWGRVRLDQTTEDGRNIVIRHLGPGDMVGTIAVLRDKPYPATPVVVESGVALYWSRSVLSAIIVENPTVASNTVELIGQRMEELQERLREVATHRVERRIASTLLRMVSHAGRRVDEGVEIPFTLSRNEIAEMNATTLHTVSRTLSAWEQEGILSGKRSSHLVITKPHRLVEIAEQG